jgi:Fe-S-cluster-containing hydrogenase component 2
MIRPVPTIDFTKCRPGNCKNGVCTAGKACTHNAFYQECPYDFPMHIADRCMGCRQCSDACPLRAIRVI